MVSILNISCEKVTEPSLKIMKYSILFNLTLNVEKQKVYIFRSLDRNETIIRNYNGGNITAEVMAYFVENANLSIIDNSDQEYPFNFFSDTTKEKYYTPESQLSLTEFGTYFLKCVIDGYLINGFTNIPGNFDIIFPTNNQKIFLNDYAEKLNIKWEESELARGYIINFIIHHFYDYEGQVLEFKKELVFITSKNEIAIPTIDLISGTVDIEIIAIDVNYFEHLLGINDSAGLEGSYGVFGSSVLKKVSISIEE